ncbi:retrovirus-related Pol polyprotein from transposon 17.6 [Trichonephila clavipes]|nr:retrovirus-related Pol polyprotein from transposon 17.6 [Trichonephila clavipes]
MQMTLADGRTQTTEILTTSVDISIQGKVIPTEVLNLKNARAPPNINALLTVDPEPHLSQLRKNEGTHLSLPQREEINSLLEKYEECFQPGGEPTPFIEHRINTRNHLPVAVPPYRMNPSKKEILKQEIDRLLSEDIIEECARFKATNQKPAGLLRTPVYSPQSNPVQRKNRDLKPRLAILVGDDHSSWYSKLPVIRFAMNTTV